MYDKDKHTNILLSLFISMQLLCPQVFGSQWHAQIKAADATNASIGCFFYAAEAPPSSPLLSSPLLSSIIFSASLDF